MSFYGVMQSIFLYFEPRGHGSECDRQTDGRTDGHIRMIANAMHGARSKMIHETRRIGQKSIAIKTRGLQ